MIKNLKILRQNKNISQQQLAEIIHVSQQSVNKYENHDVEPDIETLIKIADFFEVSVDYLIGKSIIPEPAKRMQLSDLSKTEENLIKSFRNLNEKKQDLIIEIIKSKT